MAVFRVVLALIGAPSLGLGQIPSNVATFVALRQAEETALNEKIEAGALCLERLRPGEWRLASVRGSNGTRRRGFCALPRTVDFAA
jgi:hypothetical protein